MGLGDMLQDTAKRGQLEDFAKRYDQGAPWEGISDDDNEYEESARESFQKLEPEQRREAGRSLGVGETDDPDELARATTRARKQKPDLMGQLMGNPALKGAVAGIAAQAAKRVLKR